MSNVQFSESEFARPNQSAGPGGLTGAIIKKGIAKDVATAQKILLGIFVACIVIGTGVFLLNVKPSHPTPPPPDPLTNRLP